MNENQEFEFINSKTRERAADEEVSHQQAADTVKAFAAKRRKRASLRIAADALVAAGAGFGIVGLSKIGWISEIFCGVLLCAVVVWLSFKAGYYWHEVKR